MNETSRVRASDAERERVAALVSDAAGEGRLTLAEADERMNLIYATTYRHELDPFVADLPNTAPERKGLAGNGVPRRLRIHATVAVVLSVFLIVRWVASGVPFFWPAGPMFLLWGSFLVHAAYVRRGARQWGPPPWRVNGDTN
jgi:Domain of unknown function (DUF1707)